MRKLSIERTIIYTVFNYRKAIKLERLHRWYFDVYTVAMPYTTSLENAQALRYKDIYHSFRNWRFVLKRAVELGLPIPEDINLKRYTDI